MTPAGPSIDPAAGLEQLRGLHLPANAAGAVQGEVVLAMALGFAAALLVGLVRLLRARATRSIRRSSLRELAAAGTLAPEARLIAQARLLRRLVRTLQGDAAASTHGAEWASTLDRLFDTDFFGSGAGRVLADGLYRRRGAEAGSLGSGPQGSGPQGSGPQGSGPQGSGPQGSGPQGSGPQGSGPQGSGPQGSGPQESTLIDAELRRLFARIKG